MSEQLDKLDLRITQVQTDLCLIADLIDCAMAEIRVLQAERAQQKSQAARLADQCDRAIEQLKAAFPNAQAIQEKEAQLPDVQTTQDGWRGQVAHQILRDAEES